MNSKWAIAFAIVLASVFSVLRSAQAQTFTTVYSFSGNIFGATPFAVPVQGTDGNYYGTTNLGGPDSDACGPAGCGLVYKLTPAGKFTDLYSFCTQPDPHVSDCPHGAYPEAGLVQGADGNFYGTTYSGGRTVCGVGQSYQCGTIFRITSGGDLATLHAFCSPPPCTDGTYPTAGLVQGADGSFYGTTSAGGLGAGTIFKITPAGVLTTLYRFCTQPNCADGRTPYAGLIQGADGNFYGTTRTGGATSANCQAETGTSDGCGTVFKITPTGKLTSLYSFCSQAGCQDGAYPITALVQAPNRYIYGSTQNGGSGSCSPGPGCGTLFGITPQGVLTTLYRFCSQTNCTDGYFPSTPMLAADGGVYGTTQLGGINQTTCLGFQSGSNNSCGTLFRFDRPTSVLATEYMFCAQTYCVDGGQPVAGVFQATNGHIYGTTTLFGTYFPGTVFSLSGGALSRPFVKTQTALGSVGATVNILGYKLTGSTDVSFHGTAATFQVVSDTEITATVPNGATSGVVAVTTPKGVLRTHTVYTIR